MYSPAGNYHKSDTPPAELSWLSSFGESLNVGLVVINKDYSFEFFNNHARILLDIEESFETEAPSAKSIIRFLAKRGDFGAVDPDQFTSRHMNSLKSLSQGDNNIDFINEIIPPNGRNLKISRLPSTNGFIVVTIKDVSTEQKKDEALKIALELGKAGYWTYNFDSKEFKITSSYLWSVLTPKEQDIVTNDTLMPLVHPDDVERADVFWKEAIAQTEERDIVMRLKTSKRGILWLRSHARPQFTESGRLVSVICFFEDVTANLALQDDLRQAKDQAEKTLNAQNNFLARLSHEIRTPMNAVIGITDAIVQHSNDMKIKPKLQLIQSSADSIMNILEGTLNHTKLDADKLMLNPKPGNPRETVKTICKLWETQAKKNGTVIRCHIDDKAPDVIEFDRFRYEQCLNNLLSNAVKFTPHGRVDVILTLVGEDTQNPRLILAVKDTGIGMTPEQQSRIFDAFTQADKSISSRFGGTGLGMNITKSIIEMMGGTISVKSVIGEGTVFALSLPVSLAEKIDCEKTATDNLVDHILGDASAEENSSPYSDLKILVADDNPTNHMVMESLLESIVGKIYKAENGQQVLDILEVQDIDVVLMDIHMPVMDGIESTLAIRKSDKHWSDILIIAVTADPQYQQLRLCKNIGMDDSLAKPVKLTGILEALDRVLEIDRQTAPYKEMYKTAV